MSEQKTGELTLEEKQAIVFSGLRDLQKQKFETELQVLVNSESPSLPQLKEKLKSLQTGIFKLQAKWDELNRSSSPSTHKDPNPSPKQT